MFSRAIQIDKAFQMMRTFSLVTVLGALAVAIFATYKSYVRTAEAEQRIYVLVNGKVLEAFAQDRKDNIPVEARDHVKVFHHFFFTLDPDDKAIQSGIEKALYMADGSAKQQYDNLKENGYYANLISGNVSQTLEQDTVRVDVQNYPYHFRYSAIEKITRPTTIVKRSLITEGFLRSVARSDNNPHGFLIEKWQTIENKDLEIQNR